MLKTFKVSNPCEIQRLCNFVSNGQRHCPSLCNEKSDINSRKGGAGNGSKIGSEDRFTVMVIALHNIAVAHEQAGSATNPNCSIHFLWFTARRPKNLHKRLWELSI